MHFAFPHYTTTHICTYLRPSISWSPRPRSDEYTLVKQVHALVRHGHTCSPKTCTHVHTYLPMLNMHICTYKSKNTLNATASIGITKRTCLNFLQMHFKYSYPGREAVSLNPQPTNLHCAMPFSASPCRRQPLHWFYKKARKHTNIHTYIHTYVCACLQERLSTRQLMVEEI